MVGGEGSSGGGGGGEVVAAEVQRRPARLKECLLVDLNLDSLIVSRSCSCQSRKD